MGGEAKKGGWRRRQALPPALEEAAEDERAALAAIYGSDDFLATSDGYTIRVRGQSASALLRVRYRVGYPRRAPHVGVSLEGIFDPGLEQQLSELCELQRVVLARSASVVGFAIAEALRTRLSEAEEPGVSPRMGDASPVAAEGSGWGAGGLWQDALTGHLMQGVDATDAFAELGTSPGRSRLPLRNLSRRPESAGAADALRPANPLFRSSPPPGAQRPLGSESESSFERSLESSSEGKSESRNSDGHEVSGESSDGESAGSDEEAAPFAASGARRRALRQTLLTGHLLSLATAPGGALPHALPQLSRALQSAGLLPRWLPPLLQQRPTLFQRAFRQTFAPEAAACVADPAAGWAMQRFWAAAHALAPASGEAPLSRYSLDFDERSPLGRGSFGSVVLAVNRLDGRPYAIKKVPLPDDAVLSSRVLREVATLSRLEHNSVVRYYNAWVESGGGVSSTGEEEGDDSSDWRSSATLGGGTAERAPVRAGRTLYIQMELCRSTLRDALDGPSPPDEAQVWVWMRMLLEGLVHVHSQAVVHRDLKPSNIFLGADSSLKIGDFGLARLDSDAAAPAASSAVASADETQAAGTYWYIAPEARRKLPADSKADIFSLGVVLYEMLRRFSTGMQRAAELAELHASRALPPEFVAAYPRQAQLIRLLVRPDPATRPSAAEVLGAALLPPRVGDELLSELMRSIGDGGATRDRVLLSLFDVSGVGGRQSQRGAALEEQAAAAAALRAAAALQLPGASMGAALERAQVALRAVFRRHGAQPSFPSRALALRSAGDPPPQLAVLDPSGCLLSLRSELRLGFVRRLCALARAGQAPAPAPVLRRYEIAAVQRPAPGAPQPGELHQADYDLLGDPGEDCGPTLDAEALCVGMEALEALGLRRGALLLVSHREILSACWRAAEVPSEQRPAVAALLRAPPPPDAEAAWAELQSRLCDGLGLAQTSWTRLLALHRCSGEPATALPRLRGCLGSAAGAKAAAALASLESICELAASLGLAAASLRIQPLLPPSEAYSSGIHFELHVPAAPRAEGAPSRAVAAGGRYDSLVEASWPLAQEGAAPTAVGISFSVSRLAQLALPAAASAATDVLVAARGGGGLLAERLALTAALWQAGVRAETLPQPAPSMTKQYEAVAARGARLMLIATESGLGTGAVVQVRHLLHTRSALAGKEEEWPVSDVVRRVATLLQPSEARTNAVAPEQPAEPASAPAEQARRDRSSRKQHSGRSLKEGGT